MPVPPSAPRVDRGLAALALLPLLIGAAPISRLDVGIDHIRSAKGLIRVCLTNDPDNFPSCVDDARAITRSIPAGQHSLTLPGLPLAPSAALTIGGESA